MSAQSKQCMMSMAVALSQLNKINEVLTQRQKERPSFSLNIHLFNKINIPIFMIPPENKF